jgi:hypothetical protein
VAQTGDSRKSGPPNGGQIRSPARKTGDNGGLMVGENVRDASPASGELENRWPGHEHLRRRCSEGHACGVFGLRFPSKGPG